MATPEDHEGDNMFEELGRRAGAAVRRPAPDGGSTTIVARAGVVHRRRVISAGAAGAATMAVVLALVVTAAGKGRDPDPALVVAASTVAPTTGVPDTTLGASAASTTGPPSVTASSASALAPRLAPFAIAFTPHMGVGINVANRDGSGRIRLTDSGAAPSWARDGRRIAYLDWRTPLRPDIFVVTLDGAAVTQLTETPAAAEGDPTWSPDGSELAYVVTDGDPGQSASYLAVMGSDGSNPLRLTSSARRWGVLSLSWSPDGGRIAFVQDGDVWTVTPNGKVRRQLTSGLGISRVVWSPDGLHLAFDWRDDRGSRVSMIDPDGSNRVDFAFGVLGLQPWSPDGRQLVFSSFDPGGTRPVIGDVFAEMDVVDIDGGGLRMVGGRGPYQYVDAAWSPDGEQILFGESPRLLDVAGGRFTDLHLDTDPAVWSPVPVRLPGSVSSGGSG